MTEENISKLSFEDALGALEKIVSDLESGRAPLEQSIDLYEKGVALKKHCESKLKEAQLKVDKISLDGNGNPAGTLPLDEA